MAVSIRELALGLVKPYEISSIGGAVPWLLKRPQMDPALASGPVLTTVTNICGFLLVLGIASSMLPLPVS